MTGEGVKVDVQETVGEAVRDDNFYLTRFGLGPDETSMPVIHIDAVSGKEYSGTVAQMLDRCEHVAAGLARHFAANGLDGLEKSIEAIKFNDPEFPLAVGDRTRRYHTGELSKDELLAVPEPVEDSDFLV
jgi:hypothetical protein